MCTWVLEHVHGRWEKQPRFPLCFISLCFLCLISWPEARGCVLFIQQLSQCLALGRYLLNGQWVNKQVDSKPVALVLQVPFYRWGNLVQIMFLWLTQLRCGLWSLPHCCLLAEYHSGWDQGPRLQALFYTTCLWTPDLYQGIAWGNNTWFILFLTKEGLAPSLPDQWLFSYDNQMKSTCYSDSRHDHPLHKCGERDPAIQVTPVNPPPFPPFLVPGTYIYITLWC